LENLFSHLFAQPLQIGGGGPAGVDHESWNASATSARRLWWRRAFRPRRSPSRPSISWLSSARPVEENPAGLRKVDPALRILVGWLASRLAIWSCHPRLQRRRVARGLRAEGRLDDHRTVGQV
jgi:hypothetical protein